MTDLSKFQKAFVYVLPVASLAITCTFPSALCLYWCTANFHSLATAYLLKIERVRKFMNVPEQEKSEESGKETAMSSILKFKDAVVGEEALIEHFCFTRTCNPFGCLALYTLSP